MYLPEHTVGQRVEFSCAGPDSALQQENSANATAVLTGFFFYLMLFKIVFLRLNEFDRSLMKQTQQPFVACNRRNHASCCPSHQLEASHCYQLTLMGTKLIGLF